MLSRKASQFYSCLGWVLSKNMALSLFTICFFFAMVVNAGAISFVQVNSAVPQTSQSSVAITYTSAQAAGNLNVVVVGWNDTTAVVTAVTDSKGNVYTRAVGPTVRSGVASQAIYYAKNIVAAAAGGNTVTVQFSVPASYADIRILEYSGLDTASPVDVTAAATGTNSTSNSGAVATTNANDLIFGANLVQTATSGPGTSFTRRIITNSDGDIAEDRVVTATGSYSASAPLTSAGPWIMQMVAFKAAPPDLTISKTHIGNFTQGQTGAAYTITVTNIGASPTSGVVTVADTLPAGLTATALSGTGWTCTLGTLTCTRSSVLAANASYPAITLTVNVAANASASVTNTATVSGGGDTSPGNNTATDMTTVVATGAPTVTINQASGQADPTNASPINFTVIFSAPVTGFSISGGVTIGGTAGGTKSVVVSGSGTTYNVAVSGMTNGTVVATVSANAAQDAAGNGNTASTSTDNSVTYNTTAPTVTINQASGQADPTNASPINFTVIFSAPVTGFSISGGVTIGGTAGGTKSVVVSGSGTTYNVAVSGMTNGTVVATVSANAARDAAGNGNTASASTDNSVTYNTTAPTVTINQASGQADPTNASPINFTVIFSAPVTGFSSGGGVTIGGTAGGTKSVAVTGSGTTYNVAVSGMTSGTVVATVSANAAVDATGNGNTASTSTDNSVTYNTTAPTVTINQASGQADPTNASPINFTVIFSTSVTGFSSGGVTIGGTAGGTKSVAVTGSGTTYNVAVSGMTNGTVVATVSANAARDAAGNGNTASTSTDNSVTYNTTAPTVTINQASGQADPTNASPINFTVIFSAPVTGFSISGGVTIGGTAGGTKSVVVSGSGTTYNVAVSGMTNGTVVATVSANAARDAAGNGNTASASTDNSVTYNTTAPTVTINQASGQADPTNASPINFTVIFSAPVTGFSISGGVTIGGTAGGTKSVVVSGSGTTYNVAVSGMTNGTVVATVSANAARDAAGNGNTASASTDNSVTYNTTAPTVTINQASGQADPTNASPINFTVIFSAPVTGFSISGGVTIGGTAGGTKSVVVSGSGTTYNVAVSGMTSGTVVAAVAANAAVDAAGNGNTASTSTDNSVTYNANGPPQGLVAAYSFDEGVGSTVADASGNGNTGTITNATWTSAGKYGNALVFNGTNALININDSASLHLTTGMTLEAWVNPSTVTSTWRDVIYKGNDNYYLEGTSTSGGAPACGGIFGGTAAESHGTAALAANTWSHLALTYDGATLRLYVNGVQVSSRTQTGNIPTSANPLQIGGDSIYGQFFQGTIDEVRVYNVALTPAQIQADMSTPIGNSIPGEIDGYAIGGSVSGLSGTLVVQNNGGDTLTLTSNGTFAFATPLTNGTSYDVTVLSKPSAQACIVANHAGTVTDFNVDNVTIVCANIPGYTLAVQDDFNRADGVLGANWANLPDGGMAIASGQAVGTNSGNTSGNYRTDASFNNNQYSSIGVTSGALSVWIGASVRNQTNGNLYVGIYYANNGSPQLRVYKRISGSWTQLGASYDCGTLAAGTQLTLMAVGTTIAFLQDGVEKIAVYDGDLTGGAPGVIICGSEALDNWAGGNADFAFHYLSTNVNGIESYHMVSAYNGYGAHVLRVLRPDNPAPGVAHSFLYVLPVEPEGGTTFGDGLETLRELDAQNTYNVTIIAPSFPTDPWYADHPTDSNLKYESFMTLELQPWVKANLASTGSEQHWLLGFSKSGFGGINLLFKHPDLFTRGAFWDFPALGFTVYDQWGSSSSGNYGTDANFQANYRLTDASLERYKIPFLSDDRIWISGYCYFEQEVANFDALLTAKGIVHTTVTLPLSAHTWDSGWVPLALTGLYQNSN